MIVHVIESYLSHPYYKHKTWVIAVISNYISCKLCSNKTRVWIYNQLNKRFYKDIGNVGNDSNDCFDLLGKLMRFNPAIIGRIIEDTKSLQYKFTSVVMSVIRKANMFIRCLLIGYYEAKQNRLLEYNILIIFLISFLIIYLEFIILMKTVI